MGNIISNLLITVINDWHILLSVIGAGYWFSRQTKKGLQKELRKEIKGINTRIDDHEKSVSDKFKEVQAKFNEIQATLAEIKAEMSFEKRVSKLERKLEGQQPAT